MKIAITGTIGSGKSTVLQILKEEGYPCLSADAINQQLLEDVQIQKHICDLLELASFSKENVRDAIFQNQDKKQRLEGLLHPLILDTILKCEDYKENLQFVEVPLLFEVGWEQYFDYTVVVYCDEDVAKKRLVQNRGMSIEDVNQRLRAQMPTKLKVEKANFAICNNDSAFILRILVKELLNALREKNV